jgi:hypothetical protein
MITRVFAPDMLYSSLQNLRKEKLVDVIWVVLLELWQPCADMPVYRDGEDIDGGNSK